MRSRKEFIESLSFYSKYGDYEELIDSYSPSTRCRRQDEENVLPRTESFEDWLIRFQFDNQIQFFEDEIRAILKEYNEYYWAFRCFHRSIYVRRALSKIYA
jgi:hypothetical protein